LLIKDTAAACRAAWDAAIAAGQPMLVAGSFYLAAEAKKALGK
jgi:folylpolyglutamate synthase/dihydropteroate synthase